jgi:cytochrome P450
MPRAIRRRSPFAAGPGATPTRRFALVISDRAAPPLPDETWTLAPPSAGGEPARTGRAWVFRAPGHAKLVNPVIMVEGFPGGHAYSYMYDLLNQNDMLRDLSAAGYDLVIVGLDDGMAPMQDNAPVLAECIRQARERTSRPLVVGGVSMGGLISRYTLAQMEKAGEDHGTGVYLSVDAPHRGTYTSLGVQWFVHALRDHVPALDGFAGLLDAPSNQQLMIAWLHDGAVGESDLRRQWLAELEALGHPSRPRKLAVACGRGDGRGNASAGARTLEWSVPPLVEMAIHTLPGDARHVVAEGSLFLAPGRDLPRIVSDGGVTETAWETVPGSQNTYNAQAAAVAQSFGIGPVEHPCDVTCGIPTVSALDIGLDKVFAPVADDAGPFDAHVCSPENAEHLEMTPEVSDWIVKQLGPADGEARAGDGRAAAGGVGGAFDPHAPSFITDPYPTYARLRAIGPYVDVPQFGTRWFFSYDDCVAILDGAETFQKAPPQDAQPEPGASGALQVFGPGIFSSDPPRHTKLRGHIEPVLVEALAEAPEIAERLAGERIAKARRTGGMELVADFAIPVPAGVLFAVLGIPDDRLLRGQLLRWVTAIVRAHDETQSPTVLDAGATCGMALHMYLEALVRQFRSGGGSGVIGTLSQICVDDPADPSALTVADLHMSCFDFIIAGYLSTTFLLASGLRCLLEDAEQVAALRADRDTLMGDAIQEMLRFESPLQVIDRYAAHDTNIGDTPVARGQRVTAVVGAGNRDADHFGADAGTFRIDRANARDHLAFGDGIHRCIGAPLAQLVAPVAMSALLDLDGLRIVGLPQWQTDPYIRGMINLPLRVGRS